MRFVTSLAVGDRAVEQLGERHFVAVVAQEAIEKAILETESSRFALTIDRHDTDFLSTILTVTIYTEDLAPVYQLDNYRNA